MINMLSFCNPMNDRIRLPWMLPNALVAATNGMILAVAPREAWDGIVLTDTNIKPPDVEPTLSRGVVLEWKAVPPRNAHPCQCQGYGHLFSPDDYGLVKLPISPCYRCFVLFEGRKLAEAWLTLIRYLSGVKIGVIPGDGFHDPVFFRADGDVFGAIMPMRP